MFLLWLRQLPRCGDCTPASVTPPTKGRSSPTNTPVFPPSSFVLQSFTWFYIFFSTGQVLLSALSWCSACTSVSGVFLMYLWREMYSTSTYSSAILFFSAWVVILKTIGPGKECRTNKQAPTKEFRKGQKERGNASPYILLNSQDPSHWNLFLLSNAHATRKDPESECLARDQEINPFTVKPKTVSHAAEQFSTQAPLPNKGTQVNTCVSLDN